MVKPIKTDKQYKEARKRRSFLTDQNVLGRIKLEETDELKMLELVIQDYEKKFTLGVPKEPKSCPFCGSKDLELDLARKRGLFVLCKKCLTSGPYGKNGIEAVEAWNKRAK